MIIGHSDCGAHAQRASAERRVLLCVGGLLFVQSVCRVSRTCALRVDANKRFWYISVQVIFAQSSRYLISIRLAHIAFRQIAVVVCDPRRLNKKISHAGATVTPLPDVPRTSEVLSAMRKCSLALK